MSNPLSAMSANAKAIGGSAKFIGMAVIVLVSLFGDVMFVSLMWSAFPQGFLLVLAVGGAFSTGISLIALVIGKNHWFRPGPQLVFAWCFTGAEVLVSCMNVIVAAMVARNEPLGYLSYYVMIVPVTPFLAMVGWIVIGFLDSERKELHERMEMQDHFRKAEMEQEKATHAAQMDLAAIFLKQQTAALQEEIDSPEIQQAIQRAAATLAAKTLQDLTGQYVSPRNSRTNVPQRQTAQSPLELPPLMMNTAKQSNGNGKTSQ